MFLFCLFESAFLYRNMYLRQRHGGSYQNNLLEIGWIGLGGLERYEVWLMRIGVAEVWF